jgi:hypothetical protein
MEENRNYPSFPKGIDIVDAIRQFDEYLSRNGYEPIKERSAGSKLTIEVDPYRWINAGTWREFLDLLKRYPLGLPDFNFGWTKDKGRVGLAVAVTFSKTNIIVSVNSDDPDRVAGVHEVLKSLFQASAPPPPAINGQISKHTSKKSVFIAHRFDEQGNAVAEIVMRFCSLLGFDVKDGMGYESRNIPDKVAGRINSQDTFIAIFTKGKHDWLISELAFAKALKKNLVILAETSLNVSKGIVGSDFEHIYFSQDNPYKCLLDLLSALPR